MVGPGINVGCGNEVSIRELVATIAGHIRQNMDIKIDDKRVRPPTTAVNRLLADTTRAETLPAWRPQVTVEEGLSLTIESFRSNLHQFKADEYLV